MELSKLRNELTSVRRRIKAAYWMMGIARTVSVLVIAAGVLFFLDYLFNLPHPVRIVLTIASLGLLIHQAYRFLIYPIGRKIAEDDVALAVEKRYPQLKEKLISALQISRDSETQRKLGVSGAFISRLIDEASRATEAISLKEVFEPKSLLAPGLAAFILAAAACLYGALFPQTLWMLVSRFAGGNSPWPARTAITVIEPELLASGKREIVIPRNSDLTVSVRINGVIPKKIVLVETREFRGDRTELPREFGPDPESKNVFHVTMVGVVAPFDFFVKGGDGRVPAEGYFSVSVDSPPRILTESVAVRYTYPEYTGIAPTPPNKPVRTQGIKAIEGTLVRLSAKSDQALSDAEMRIYPVGKREETLAVIPCVVIDDAITAEFVITHSADYQLIISRTTVRGRISNEQYPFEGRIHCEKDGPPEIRLTEPSADLQLTPFGEFKIKAVVKDDYGIVASSRTILVKKQETSSGPVYTLFERGTHFEEEIGSRRFNIGDTLSLSPLSVNIGDAVILYLTAVDNKAFPEPDGSSANITDSRRIRISIVSEDTIRRQIAAMQRDLARQIDEYHSQAKKNLARTESLGEGLEKGAEVVSPERAAELSTARKEHSSIVSRLSTLTRGFEEVVKKYENNNLSDEDQLRMREGARQTGRLAEGPAAGASAALENARRAETPEAQKEALAEAARNQEEIVKGLAELAIEMNRFVGFNDIIQALRDVIDNQRKINESALNEAQKGLED